jgi:hypothetical protein
MAQLLAATLLAAISYRDIVEQDHTGRKSALDELRSTARGIESHIRPHPMVGTVLKDLQEMGDFARV